MPKTKSAAYIRQSQALSSGEAPVVLIEISHALLAEPIRLVNDNADLLSNGHNYVAASFTLVWPDDQDKQTPRAQVSIGNVRGEVGAFFERTHGGRGALFTLLQVLRSTPDTIEEKMILDLGNIEQGVGVVSGTLGYDEILNRVGTPYTYRPETAPGLF